MMVIAEDLWIHTYCWAFGSGAVITCFYDLCLTQRGFEHPTFRMRGTRSNPQRYRRGDIFNLHMSVKARIEVKLSCDVISMFCDVLLYQMHVKYQKFRLLR